jgi:hypothetical protein
MSKQYLKHPSKTVKEKKDILFFLRVKPPTCCCIPFECDMWQFSAALAAWADVEWLAGACVAEVSFVIGRCRLVAITPKFRSRGRTGSDARRLMPPEYDDEWAGLTDWSRETDCDILLACCVCWWIVCCARRCSLSTCWVRDGFEIEDWLAGAVAFKVWPPLASLAIAADDRFEPWKVSKIRN